MDSENSTKKHVSEYQYFADSDELFNLGIAEKGENIINVFERVVDSLTEIELRYENSEFAERFRNYLLEIMKDRKFIPSTTILMNAGRINSAPLSACAVPQVDLKQDLTKIKKTIDQFHFNGMGTGFNFDDVQNPIEIIKYLNKIGIEGQQNKKQLRPVGNMGVLSIDHPSLFDFINVKNKDPNQQWVFNFSVLINDIYLDKIRNKELIILKDGSEIPSEEIIDAMARSIYISAEPGLVFIDRLNKDNQVVGSGEYKSLAPCGEVGLVEGETCQFSYINIGKFVSDGIINYPELEKTVKVAVKFLDNAVDYNIDRYDNDLNKKVAEQKRRIGLGICGFADLLKILQMGYSSEGARKQAEDIFSFINFVSKRESVELAKTRGSFGGFPESKYMSDENIITAYSRRQTETVSGIMWLALEREVKKCGIRNCSTVAVPPTGRSSRVIGASPSIEPYFSDILKVSPENQIKMISSIQKFTDESISKTINISQDASVGEIKRILLLSMESNLKGITIYRDKSREAQPQKI